MLVIGFCYNRVYRNIRQHNKNVIHSLQEARKFGISAQEIKTSRVLFAAVLGFIICWTPFIYSDFNFSVWFSYFYSSICSVDLSHLLLHFVVD